MMTNMMTEIEAKEILHSKLCCMELENTSLPEKRCNQDCDNCNYCYGQGTFREQEEALVMAIKSLEKQIPKKPIERIKMIGLDKGGKCPVCQKYVNNHNHWLYCECGQKLDWE